MGPPASDHPTAGSGSGLRTLTDDEVRAWSREQKDRFWLEHVFRGAMPQLTVRSALTGFVLGGVLSATNLYVGAKTGWTLGVGLTSVILAFAAFRVLSRLGVRDMTILENNASQSVATAAGYMTGPLISGLTAYMWVENRPIDWFQMTAFNVVLSLLGVLVAFPMKRRFINDEQHPFPEGRACGVVLDTLYTADARSGVFKAKALGFSAGLAGLVSFLSGESWMRWVQERLLGLKAAWHLPHTLDAWYWWLVEKGHAPILRLANVDIRQLGLTPTLDLAMFGAGGLMGMRTAASLVVGMVLNYVVIVPWMISVGEIAPKTGAVAAGTATFGRAHILNSWALWWGITIMVVASLVSLFAKPEVFAKAFRMLRGGRAKAPGAGADVVAHIEVPLWISWVGVPVVGAVGVVMAHQWFGVSWVFGAAAIPMILVLTLIAASSTALTGITPTGSLSKIPQFTFGALDPRHAATNLMTGVMCVEVASNASNLLMDIKPGYMLGGKPRHQALGHCIGIVAGAIASTPLFFVLFLSGYAPGTDLSAHMAPDGGAFSFPSAVQWKGVSDLVTSLFAGDGGRTLLTRSIAISMAVAAAAGVAMEALRIKTKQKFPLSPLAIGLGVVVPPDSSLAMFAGALFFWVMARRHAGRPGTRGHLLWVDTQEPVCAGIIAGAALLGIGDVLVKVFLL